MKKKVNQRKDIKIFRNSANKTNKLNVLRTIPRGGIRL